MRRLDIDTFDIADLLRGQGFDIVTHRHFDEADRAIAYQGDEHRIGQGTEAFGSVSSEPSSAPRVVASLPIHSAWRIDSHA